MATISEFGMLKTLIPFQSFQAISGPTAGGNIDNFSAGWCNNPLAHTG
jgi:hypothetical protein